MVKMVKNVHTPLTSVPPLFSFSNYPKWSEFNLGHRFEPGPGSEFFKYPFLVFYGRKRG